VCVLLLTEELCVQLYVVTSGSYAAINGYFTYASLWTAVDSLIELVITCVW
jgi:hypothetical protein